MVSYGKVTIKDLMSRIPVPPGISPQDFYNMVSRDPELLEKLLAQQGENVGMLRQAYQRMFSMPMTDKDFESALNDPELQGRLQGQQIRDQKKRQQRYASAMRQASR